VAGIWEIIFDGQMTGRCIRLASSYPHLQRTASQVYTTHVPEQMKGGRVMEGSNVPKDEPTNALAMLLPCSVVGGSMGTRCPVEGLFRMDGCERAVGSDTSIQAIRFCSGWKYTGFPDDGVCWGWGSGGGGVGG
jgi:hypothetical protein